MQVNCGTTFLALFVLLILVNFELSSTMFADFAHELDMLLGAIMAFAVREVLNQYFIGFEESFQDGSIKQLHHLIGAS